MNKKSSMDLKHLMNLKGIGDWALGIGA